jgi:hypothetical protein
MSKTATVTSISSARKPPTASARLRKASKPDLASVMGQLAYALRRNNLPATAIGFLLGGFVPLATFMIVHYQLSTTTPLYLQPLVLMVCGGLVFSAKTVFEWTALAFGSKAKALGFVVLLEGVLLLSTQPGLSLAALAYLVTVNGIATGVRLASACK